MRAAVVSTQRHVRATLASYLRWHLSGARFDHVYLYFDAPEDDADAIAVARDACWEGRVTVLEANESFRVRETYSSLPSWDELAPTVQSMVQARQRLNCEHCLSLCAAEGISWLLHIDADELFMPATGEDAPAHFERLDAQGCWQFTYRNLEAVPTSPRTAAAHREDDYFARVNVFKQHEGELPGGALEAVGTGAHAALHFWLERARSRVGKPVWFFFYSNGKSAVKVDASVAIRCAGVHGWAPSSEADGAGAEAQGVGGWRTNIRKVAQRSIGTSAVRGFDGTEGAVVLHYACCTSQGFAGKDWRALGYLGSGGGPWARRWHRMQKEEAAAAAEGAAQAAAVEAEAEAQPKAAASVVGVEQAEAELAAVASFAAEAEAEAAESSRVESSRVESSSRAASQLVSIYIYTYIYTYTHIHIYTHIPIRIYIYTASW